MSEKTLDDVIRQLRMSATYLQNAEDKAEQLMHDHNITMMIHSDIYGLKDTISYLEHQYRKFHYGR